MSLISAGIYFMLIAFLIIDCVESAPSKYKNLAKNCSDSDNEDDNEDFHELIDQRQNGTENLRISFKDFVFVWAPSDILLTAAALLDSQLLGGDLFEELTNGGSSEEIVGNKPSPSISASTTEAIVTEDDKITVNSAVKRAKLRIPSLVTTLLKKP